MKQRPLPSIDVPDPGAPAEPPRCAPLPTRLGVTEPGPEEPLAVVVAGPAGAGRRELLAGLLGQAPGMLAVPAGSYLLVNHAKVPTRAAYVPGYRQPHSYGADPLAAGPALARPPRRVELSLPDPLLRHFAVLDTPDTGSLGVAGDRVLLDAVGRAGALLFVISADQAFTAAELHLLTEVARARVEVFFAVTPGAAGWAAPADGPTMPEDPWAFVPPAGRTGPPAPRSAGHRVDPVEVTLAAHRAALLSAVPGLAPARWYPARQEDHSDLRRALVSWAADEGLRRASADPPEPPGAHQRVAVLPGLDPGDLTECLDRQARSCAQRIRQHLALELANIHLRVVQEVVFGVGCAGLPQLLDREMEALSLLATAQCDEAVRGIVDDLAARVFGAPLAEGVRRRITHAVRWGLADQPASGDLDRVLLVTSTAGVAGLSGTGAMDALAGFPGAQRDEVLPPVGVALSGGCWQHWRAPVNDDPNGARSWAQRALREVELDLSREVSRRFEVIRLSLGAVLTDAVDHGILLA
ncbi:hypothetical protein ONA91_13640 [Micromonospora sp. DR5-3]|uniref:hypothetical protein n=1 Tax=unclassified Micromonospora TaxID=2617518 RepID=UPI0011D48495|nr:MULTISPECIES: hypothetical protein [unclassified Micromonospora]MCW3815497.1 hypothetical protein [Micromonospora sp. DR5-3]TYC24305.1 hypothetical protein FXF52_11175 [Micromonospora sp. MP36]